MTLHKDLIDLSNLIDSIIRDYRQEILSMEKNVEGVVFSLPKSIWEAKHAIKDSQLCYDVCKGLNDD